MPIFFAAGFRTRLLVFQALNGVPALVAKTGWSSPRKRDISHWSVIATHASLVSGILRHERFLVLVRWRRVHELLTRIEFGGRASPSTTRHSSVRFTYFHLSPDASPIRIPVWDKRISMLRCFGI